MDGPLDMRLDRTSQRMTAADLVNHAAERELADLIFRFGGERRARRAARAIVRARPLRSTLHLASVVARAVPRTSGLHPATRTFMALRVAVNDEPGELDRLLAIAPSLIARGGRMAIISFSSLEDGQIKRKFRAYEKAGGAAVLTKHPLRPGRAEVTRNPAARSAKLRALEIV
jgi:16S rRNA (cytosine1402-N4)-methyltransferase